MPSKQMELRKLLLLIVKSKCLDSVILWFFPPPIRCFNPATVYGRVKSAPIQRFVPDFVKNNKIILTFSGFFRQQIAEPNREKYNLIRNVKVMYFMEDDTMTVIEPTIMVNIYPICLLSVSSSIYLYVDCLFL